MTMSRREFFKVSLAAIAALLVGKSGKNCKLLADDSLFILVTDGRYNILATPEMFNELRYLWLCNYRKQFVMHAWIQ